MTEVTYRVFYEGDSEDRNDELGAITLARSVITDGTAKRSVIKRITIETIRTYEADIHVKEVTQ